MGPQAGPQFVPGFSGNLDSDCLVVPIHYNQQCLKNFPNQPELDNPPGTVFTFYTKDVHSWLPVVGFQKEVSQSKLEIYVNVRIIYINYVSCTTQSCKDLRCLRSYPPLESPLVDLSVVEISLCSTGVISIVVQYWKP